MHVLRSVGVAMCAVLLFGGCVATPEPLAPVEKTSAEETVEDSDGLPEPHPAFAAHFSDPLYEDSGGDFAPFGTDEGWDLVMEWGERRDELEPDITVRELLRRSDFAGAESEGSVDGATITIGAGFTVLRLTGQIDETGLQDTLRALQTLEDFYGPIEEVAVQRRDLESWAN